jgi:hypothetical protein
MRKHCHLTRAILIGCLLLAMPSTITASTQDEQLRRMMADIALLNNQLAQRKADAAGIRDALTVQIKALKSETWRLWRDGEIKSDKQALENPRIRYNLMLMAEIQAYIKRYAQKMDYYRVASNRLSYLYQQADDDLKIVNTLSGMKIDALISQTQKILDAYLPDAQTLVVHPETLTIDTPEATLRKLKSAKQLASNDGAN